MTLPNLGGGKGLDRRLVRVIQGRFCCDRKCAQQQAKQKTKNLAQALAAASFGQSMHEKRLAQTDFKHSETPGWMDWSIGDGFEGLDGNYQAYASARRISVVVH